MTPQELKNSILQLSIQGKLVEQRPEEGTAEELFAQIQREKQRLIVEKKIKKEKPMPEITEDEKPFEIPESWLWVKLGDVLREVIVPMRDKPTFSKEGIPWCRIEDRDGFLLNGSKSNQLVSDETIKNMNLKVFPVGTVLSACTGGSIGTIVINTIECCTNQTFNGLVCSSGLLNWYLFWYLKTQFNKLRKVGTGTTIAYVSQKKSKEMLLPLPPLAEQKRIVAKIEELLPYIDRYEQAWSKLEQFNSRFPEDMKKSLLQYAIQGKLVEQRPEEGTAEELFAQIQQEKQQLIAEKKIKKEKPLPEITEDEKPFDIPESWKWVRMSEVIDIRDGTHDTPNYLPTGYPLITGKDFYNGYFDLSKTQYISAEDYLLISQRSKVDPYDILFSMIGGNIGSMIRITPENYFEMSIKNVALFKQYIHKDILSKYLFYYLKGQIGQMKATAKGGAQMFVSLKMLRSYFFPLPPLAEQKRIVEKLELLLPLCERLK